MLKTILKTTIVSVLISTAYFCLFDFIFLYADLSTNVSELLFGFGFWLVLRVTVSHLRKKLGHQLRYQHVAIACVSICLCSLLLYRLFCLQLHGGIEFFYLAKNSGRLSLSGIMLIILSLLTARYYKSGPSVAGVPQHIDDSFDIDINQDKKRH